MDRKMNKTISARLLISLLIPSAFLFILLSSACSERLDPPLDRPTAGPVKTATTTLKPTSTPTLTPTPLPASRWAEVPWADRLKKAADSFIRENPLDALRLVQSLGFVQTPPGSLPEESVDNACGPLAVSILNTAGIFYPKKSPLVLHDWWEPDPALGEPWGMLDMSHYKLYQFLTYPAPGRIGNVITRKVILGDLTHAVHLFDFSKFPLCPGDWIYTRSRGTGFDHILVVSEVDQQDRVWTVDNTPDSTSNKFIISRALLFDPSDLMAGEMKVDFANQHGGTSGMAGFWLLRLNGGCKTPPGYEQFLVNP